MINIMRRPLLTSFTLLACFSLLIIPQAIAQEPLDGRDRPFRDEFIDHLVGKWKLTRKFKNRSVENGVNAQWVLNHQFLLLHMKDESNPSAYEAMVYIGYDHTSERYVAHWIDVFGGRFSETLGYGSRSGDSIKFVFEYPDGPFHNTFTWNAEAKTWTFLMQQKDRSSKGTLFGEDTLKRIE
jgi:Protein of unknown function (DUF1579)